MKIFRFMSKQEFEKYQNGELLINNTIHQGKTNSIGFCFLKTDDYMPEKALHFLSGVASLDICAVFETKQKLKQTKGTYAKMFPSTGNAVIDFLRVLSGMTEQFDVTEYCTTQYSNKDFKLLKYSENLYSQWQPEEIQSKLKWKEGVLNV